MKPETDGATDRRVDDVSIAKLVETVSALVAASAKAEKNWRFEKQISVGNLLTMLIMSGAVFGAWSTINTRVSNLETLAQAQVKTDDRQERQAELQRLEIRAELDKINIKLDRLGEQRRP